MSSYDSVRLNRLEYLQTDAHWHYQGVQNGSLTASLRISVAIEPHGSLRWPVRRSSSGSGGRRRNIQLVTEGEKEILKLGEVEGSPARGRVPALGGLEAAGTFHFLGDITCVAVVARSYVIRETAAVLIERGIQPP